MTELYTALTVFLPFLTVLAAGASNPVDAEGNPVPRSKRTFWSDVRGLVR